MPEQASKRIGVIVPEITNTGGVASVAEFVIRAIREKSQYQYKIVSLAMAARDRASLLLTQPGTWARGAHALDGDFRGYPFRHVGAIASEIESRRYLPRRVLAREVADCDLLQVVAGVPAWANPVMDLGKPVSLQVATLIDVERRRLVGNWQGPAGTWRRLMTRRIRALDDAVLQRIDAVQVENNWMLDHCRTACERSGVDLRFAAPGVDTDLFQPCELRPDLPGYIMTVGRMSDPRKRHMLLLEAYRILCERMELPPRLLLAGPDGPTLQFQERASELGLWDRIDVHIFPEKTELARLYREAGAFVLASDEEGFGVTVIEAMASGIPVISTRSGGPDDIIADGVDGYLVDRDDAQALADRMTNLSSNHQRNIEMGIRARRSVEERYSEAVTASAFIEVFDTLLQDSPAA